ncbi:hypothetical protein Ga0061079_104132 [Apibacter mensalis]|uniref:Uncharacterized protein n=1 Tax=Apibacter mensalis TaxID=1586267 RepID=A0A0X3AP47_9FLAO|nr:hypothetical protein Ga0061079_104132 [Apibacter mensalis]
MKIKLLSVLIFFCLISFSQDLRIQGKVNFEKSEFDKLAEVIAKTNFYLYLYFFVSYPFPKT